MLAQVAPQIDIVQVLLNGGLPAVGALAVAIGVRLIMKNADASEKREGALSSRLGNLEDKYRTEVVALHTATITSLNANTAAITANTLAVERLHAQSEKNHAATSTLLDQLISDRCDKQ